MSKCILCGGKTKVLQVVQKSLLKRLYLQQFNIDIDNLIPTDLNYYACKSCTLRFFVCKDGSIPTGDDAFYNALNQIEWYYASEKCEYEYSKNYINDDMKILEVGCGKAAFFDYLPPSARENYVGLEFSSGAIEQAKKRGIKIESIAIEEFAKEHKGEFDVVCSFQVLEHVKNPYDFLKSQIECLKMGGLLIVAVPSEDGIARYYINNILNVPPHHISRWKDKALHKIAELFSLEVVDIWHDQLSEDEKKAFKMLIVETNKMDKLLLGVNRGRQGLLYRLKRSIKKRLTRIPNDYNHTVVAVYRKR